MRREDRGTDFLIGALVFSVVIHAAVMIYMRPQIMTKIAAGFRRSEAKTMVITDTRPIVEPLKMSELKDIEAKKDAPSSVIDSSVSILAPSLVAVSDSDDAPKPKVEIPDLLYSDVSGGENRPIIRDSALLGSEFDAPQLSMVAAASELKNNSAGDEGDAPMVDLAKAPLGVSAPDYYVAIEAPKIAKTEVQDIPEEMTAEKGMEVTDKVLSEVDEGLVEKTKEVVKDMLNVKDAVELAPFVKVNSFSAQDESYVYFKFVFAPDDSVLSTIPKDVVVLLDASGSIGSDRLKSCRVAARRILRTATNTGDRFNFVAFRDRFMYAFDSWQQCDAVSFERADKWLDRLAAHGRTDVFSTIRSVLTLPRDPVRPLIALVVTDGDANYGIRDSAEIISKFSRLNDGLVSVYMYGVKEKANKKLIDVLTHGNRGDSFIYGGKRWNAGSGIEGLSERFRDPLLSDLRLIYAANSSSVEAYPRLLKNLYRGEELELFGRAPKGTTSVSFSLRGLNRGKAYEGFFTVDLTKSEFDKSLPKLWAEEQSIDALLK